MSPFLGTRLLFLEPLGKTLRMCGPNPKVYLLPVHTQATAPHRARPRPPPIPPAPLPRTARALAGIALSTVHTPSPALRSRGRSAGPRPCPPLPLSPPTAREQSLRARPPRRPLPPVIPMQTSWRPGRLWGRRGGMVAAAPPPPLCSLVGAVEMLWAPVPVMSRPL